MRRFAQIEVDPRDAERHYVHWIFQADANPYPPTVTIRDVTDVSPAPQESWAANDDGTYAPPAQPQPEPPPQPEPNTPGNPYFGKPAKLTKDFWGLVLTVYIALGGSSEAGMDRQGRLLSSKRALGILKVADSVGTIDPDDKDGDFLKMTALLTTTNHEDGALLIELAEFAAIMAAWT